MIGAAASGPPLDWPTLGVILAAIVGLVGLALKIGSSSRAELREDIERLKAGRIEDREACAAELAEVNGRVAVLTGEFASRLAREVRSQLREDLRGLTDSAIAPSVKEAIRQGIAEAKRP